MTRDSELDRFRFAVGIVLSDGDVIRSGERESVLLAQGFRAMLLLEIVPTIDPWTIESCFTAAERTRTDEECFRLRGL